VGNSLPESERRALKKRIVVKEKKKKKKKKKSKVRNVTMTSGVCQTQKDDRRSSSSSPLDHSIIITIDHGCSNGAFLTALLPLVGLKNP
jgi:hypothetical protein